MRKFWRRNKAPDYLRMIEIENQLQQLYRSPEPSLAEIRKLQGELLSHLPLTKEQADEWMRIRDELKA